jgi:hypothetical protein
MRHVGVHISVALAIGVSVYLASGSILNSAAIGLLGSIVGSYLLSRLDLRANRRLTHLGLPDGSYPARIYASAIVHGPPDEVLFACEQALRNLPNFGKLTRSVDGSVVHARTRHSSDSWGERIAVQVGPARLGTRIQVSSVLVLWTVTEDMRFNFQNVALVMREISQTFPLSDVRPSELLDRVVAK